MGVNFVVTPEYHSISDWSPVKEISQSDKIDGTISGWDIKT